MALLTRTRRALPVLLLTSYALITGCERPPTALTFENQRLGVYALLLAGEDTARILVIRHPATSTYLDPSGIEGVRDADVSLATPGGSVALAPAEVERCFQSDDPRTSIPFKDGCYTAALPEPVLEGESYDLRVLVPGSEPVEGTAVVPRRPDLVAPTSDASVNAAQGLFLDWRPVEGADRYSVRLLPGDSGCETGLDMEEGTSGLIGGEEATVDTLGIRLRCPDESGGLLFPDSVPALIRFTSVDSAYSAWAEAVAEPDAKQVLLSRASPGLRGRAVGFFGAMASIERQVVIDPDW